MYEKLYIFSSISNVGGCRSVKKELLPVLIPEIFFFVLAQQTAFFAWNTKETLFFLVTEPKYYRAPKFSSSSSSFVFFAL